MSRWVYWVSLTAIIVILGYPLLQMVVDPLADYRSLFKLGIDLEGGTSLVYQLRTPEEGVRPDAEVVRRTILRRIDPQGVQGYTVNQLGKSRIEIVIPGRRAAVKFKAAEPLTAERIAERRKEEKPPPDALAAYEGGTRLVVRMRPPLYIRDITDRIAQAVLWRQFEDQRFEVVPLEAGGERGHEKYDMVAVWLPFPPTEKETIEAWREAIEAGLATNPDVEDVKRLVGQAGFLQFRIVADRFQDRDKVAGGDFETIVNLKRAGRPSPNDRFKWYPVSESYYEDLTKRGIPDEYIAVHDKEAKRTELLVDVGDGQDITGEDLASVSPDSKPTGEPIVSFSIKPRSQQRMARLTKKENYGRSMAILLDGEIRSAPTLGGRRSRDEYQPLATGGIIEGYANTAERDRVLQILQSGNLGANLGDPVFERTVGPELGEDNIRKGVRAIAIGLVLVLAFMAVYYRFAGLVADVALLLNLALVVAILFIANQAWTLPGIAGLILTVGMSVDANVLIFERIREERGKEGSLAFAVRRAYSRAFRTILDANVTTLIPALALMVFATEEVQGFAIVIIVGIAMSMFTALVFTRMVFEAGVQAGWVKDLRMQQWIEAPNVDWMRLARRAIVVSGVLVLAGGMYFYTRGRDKYDIEFTGGTQVDVALAVPGESETERLETVRDRVAETFAPGAVVQRLDVEARPGAEQGLSYFRIRVASTGQAGEGPIDETTVRKRLPEAFADMWPEAQAGVRIAIQASRITDDLIREQMRTEPAEARGPAPEGDATEAEAVPEAEAGTPGPEQGYYFIPPELRTFLGKLRLQFTVSVPMAEQDVQAELLRFLRERHPEIQETEVRVRGTTGGDRPGRFKAFDLWVAVPHEGRYAGVSNAEFWTGVLEGALGQREFLSATSFEATMAAESWQKAILAIVGSLAFIVLYIWIRFAKPIYGIAAVAALAHDVFIVLGAVALTAVFDRIWSGNWLLLTDMKINLPMVGAFLTLIGYSLNDTIVVFDRIRENRGKFGDLSVEVTNRSINQTLTRTIWTSLTTFMVVAVLYVLGGTASTLHGFAYVLTLGVIVGTYSSMAIASPILVLRGYLMRVYAVALPVLGIVVTAYYLLSVGFAVSPAGGAIVAVWLVWLGLATWGTRAYATDQAWTLQDRAPWLAKGVAGAGLVAPLAFVAMLLVVQFAPEESGWATWAGPMAVGALFSLPAMFALYRKVYGSFFEKG